MSNLDSNPFSDPFSDSDVTQARNNSRLVNSIDDFNPFENDQFASRQPAVLPTASDPPPYTAPSASATAAVAAGTDDLRRRQEELDRKAFDLERRERDMQQNVQRATGGIQNNFPPLPACFPVKPCFYQDFTLDIPAEFQLIVKFAFYLWIAYCIVLFVNIFASLAYFITASIQCNSNSYPGTTFGLSMLYFFLWTPSSYVCWFRPAYNAFRSDSSFFFFVFFFVFFVQSCTCVVQCIGIDGSGTVGYISGFGMMGCNKGVATLMIVIGVLFTILAVACFMLLIRVHRYYRSSGATFSKAQAEFAQGVISNRTVQETTAGVASAAARGAVDQYSGGNYDNRY